LLRGVIIPLKPIRELEGKHIGIKIVKVEELESLYSYLRLVREGEDDTKELFEM